MISVDTQVVEVSEGRKWEKQTLIRSTINSGYVYITQFENNPGNFVSCLMKVLKIFEIYEIKDPKESRSLGILFEIISLQYFFTFMMIILFRVISRIQVEFATTKVLNGVSSVGNSIFTKSALLWDTDPTPEQPYLSSGMMTM